MRHRKVRRLVAEAGNATKHAQRAVPCCSVLVEEANRWLGLSGIVTISPGLG
jgi:hypothetical protein